MTKNELANSIAKEVNLPANLVLEIVRKVLNGLTDAVEEEGRLELRNFGILYVKKSKPWRAHNPRTGAFVQVPARKTVKFKPGKVIVDRIIRPKKSIQE